jgi:lysophospholipase L1-like esterase
MRDSLKTWFTAALIAGLASGADALEGPPPTTGWENQGGPWSNGLYAIGDSISLFVPYISTGSARGHHVWERGGIGWSTQAHRVSGWGVSGLSSIEDAARSPASVVWVQLGTNDTNCLRPNTCWGGVRDEAQAQAERWKIVSEVVQAAQRLVAAGKCVLWAGPREIEREGASLQEAINFNELLRYLANQYSGRFFYVDYDAATWSNDRLRSSLDDALSDLAAPDGIHPRTAEGREVIATLAFDSARERCGLP